MLGRKCPSVLVVAKGGGSPPTGGAGKLRNCCCRRRQFKSETYRRRRHGPSGPGASGELMVTGVRIRKPEASADSLSVYKRPSGCDAESLKDRQVRWSIGARAEMPAADLQRQPIRKGTALPPSGPRNLGDAPRDRDWNGRVTSRTRRSSCNLTEEVLFDSMRVAAHRKPVATGVRSNGVRARFD